MSPGGDAVGFVDGDQRRLAFGKHLGEAGNPHPFGCDEQKLKGAVKVVAAGLTSFVTREAGVNASDSKTCGGELGGLVVHESDKGRDDKSRTASSDGWKLIAETFAGSGGHDKQNIVAIGRGAADGLLIRAKGREAKGLMKESGEIHER